MLFLLRVGGWSSESTSAHRIAHNRDARGFQGVIFTRDDRAGEGKLSSRLGLVTEAVKAPEGKDLYAYPFGITTDFRTKLFPGSQRLIELADRLEQLQVEALCWCGARATHNARTVGGEMVIEGAQVVVGDVNRHAGALSPDVLPVNHA